MPDGDLAERLRATYLTKLGVRRSLGIVLSPSLPALVLDVESLRKRALHQDITSASRPLIWLLLLKVLPPQVNMWEFVLEQQREQYEDIASAAVCLHPMPKNTSSSSFDAKMDGVRAALRTYADMHRRHVDRSGGWVRNIEAARQKILSPSSQRSSSNTTSVTDEIDDALAIQDCLLLLSSFLSHDESSIFWAAARLVVHGSARAVASRTDAERCAAYLKQLMKIHAKRVSAHLLSVGFQIDEVTVRWFRSCFACILPKHIVLRVLDRAIASDERFLVHFALSLFRRLQPLLASPTPPPLSTPEEICNFISTLSEGEIERTLNYAVHLYLSHTRSLCQTCSIALLAKQAKQQEGVVTAPPPVTPHATLLHSNSLPSFSLPSFTPRKTSLQYHFR